MKLQRDSLISLLVGGVLVVLLPLLAALQYRWLGQVSEGEREQMKAGLQTTARRISEDFDQELTRAFVAFFNPQDKLDDETSYAERWQHWQETARDIRLIKTLFLAPAQENNTLLLRRFKPADNKFSSEAWTGDIGTLQPVLEQRLKIIRNAFSQQPPQMPPPPNLSANFNGELPAFVIPITRVPYVGEGDQTPSMHGFVIALLDAKFIQQELLPALVKQHLDMANYDLAILNRNEAKKVFWQSSPTGFSNADAAQPMFGLRFSELQNSGRNQSAAGGRPQRMFGAMGGVRGGPNDSRAWELRLRHRAGSLEAAVQKIRRRNLLISSSIMLLLVTSVGFLMLSVRRAKKLAQQQMDFVAGVSHELRTPLAVIDSAGYNLTRGVIKDPQRVSHYGALIRKETRRLQEMVEQILEFAGVQSGKQKYELHPTNVNQVVHEVISASQPLLTEAGFQLETNIAPDLPAVLADAPALGRALQNLVSNAMKYSGESRWIGINAALNKNGSAQEVQLSVSDHGLGISAEDQRHIFEPFYRGSEVKAAQIHGNGLGLSLVKNIVSAHNGRVRVESTEGQGSTFFITLPAIAEEILQTSALEAKTELRV